MGELEMDGIMIDTLNITSLIGLESNLKLRLEILPGRRLHFVLVSNDVDQRCLDIELAGISTTEQRCFLETIDREMKCQGYISYRKPHEFIDIYEWTKSGGN